MPDMNRAARSMPRHPNATPKTVGVDSLTDELREIIETAGDLPIPTSRIPFGNAESENVTTDSEFSYDSKTKRLRAPLIEATNDLYMYGATAFYVRLRVSPAANGSLFVPSSLVSDTIVCASLAQTLANKTLLGPANSAAHFLVTNNAPVEAFSIDAYGSNGAGAGAAGLSARLPFRAANGAGTLTRSGAIEGGWINPAATTEHGFTALCGTYAGVAYPAVRAVVPAAAAAYVNGVEFQGAVTGQAPVLRPFGSDTNITLRAMGLGTGGFSIYNPANTQAYVTVDANGLSFNGVPTQARPLLALGATSDDIINMLNSLGLTRLV